MQEWNFVQTEEIEQFCRIQQFGIKKEHDGENIEFVITVREYCSPPDPAVPFFAQADKQVNQHSMPYTPSGWGSTLEDALWECVKAIRKFPYQPGPRD